MAEMEFDFESASDIQEDDFQDAPEASPESEASFDFDNALTVGTLTETGYFDNHNSVVELPSGTFDRIKAYTSGAYNKGIAAGQLNDLYFNQIIGDDTSAFSNQINSLKQRASVEFGGIGTYEDFFRASVEATPDIIGLVGSSAKRGAQGAAIGAATGFAAGNLTGVGVALPEELLTVPTGAVWGARKGALIGAGEYSFRQNAGETYGYISEMLDKEGVKLENKNLAKLGAVMAGAANAGMDMIPIGYLSKAFVGKNLVLDELKKSGAKSLVIPKGKEAIAKFVVDYAKYIAVESATEGVQEGVKAGTGEMVKYFSDQEFENLAVEEILSQMGSAAKEAAKATAVLGMAGSAAKGGYHVTKNAIGNKKGIGAEEGGIDDQIQAQEIQLNSKADILDNLAAKSELSGDLKTAKAQKDMAADLRTEAAAFAEVIQKKPAINFDQEQNIIQQEQERAKKLESAIAPIKEQQENVKSKKIQSVENTIDDLRLNTLREISSLQDNKNIVDDETVSMLEHQADLLKERRKASLGYKPDSLTQYIKKKFGGMADYQGELDSRGINKKSYSRFIKSAEDKTADMFGKVNNSQRDEIKQSVYDAGYFPHKNDYNEISDSELYDAIAQDLQGSKIYDRETLRRIDDSNINEIESALDEIDRLLLEKDIGTDSRERLNELRKKVSENRKLDRKSASISKKSMAEESKLDELKSEMQAKDAPIILADKLKTFISGIKKGKVLQKKETVGVQNQLIDMIEQSELEPDDRSKFIRTIKNTQTIEQLQKKIPEIAERIKSLVDATQKRTLYSDIKSALSGTKYKKQSGKPIGKYGAETQVLLDSAREAINLPVDKAKAQLDGSIFNSGIPSPEQAITNRALAIAAKDDSLSVSDLQSFLNDINSIIKTGKADRKDSLFARSVLINSMKIQAYEEMTKGENIDIIDETSWRRKLQKMGNNLKALQDGWLFGWYDIPDILFGNSSLRDKLRVGKQVSNQKKIVRQQMEELEIAAQNVFGFTKRKQWLKKMIEDSKIIDLGEMPNSSGKMIRLQMNKAQMRKLWMEWQDPTLHETLFSSYGGNQYTENMLKSIMQNLEPEDRAFAQAQMNIYQKFYNEINDVYSSVYGVNLPNNENYSPISRETDSEIETGAFLTEQQYRNSVASGSLKSRVKNLHPLRKQSDIDVYQRHILDMAHFIAFAEKAQEIQGVFSDGGVRKAIKKMKGEALPSIIDGYIKTLIRDGAERSDAYGRSINTLNRNFALSVLGGKIAMIPKQMSSFVSSAADMPIGTWSAGIIDFAKNPKKAINILSKSEIMKARGHSAEQDIASFGKSADWEFLKKKQSFDNIMMTPIRLGDRAAIYSGGWPIYYNAIKQGKTPEQAINEFETWVETTQQSGSIDQLSLAQAASPFVRTFTMFRSAPSAYLRAEIRAVRHWKSGEITTAQLAKKIAIYHVIIPMLFQFIANGFEWDDEDQAKAAILGPIDGYFILGDLIARSVEGFDTAEPTFIQFANNMWSGIQKTLESDWDMDEISDGIKDIAKGASMGTGLPVSATENIVGGISDIDEGESGKGIKRILGWPKGAVDKD